MPDMGAERCLGPEKMGPSWGRGVRGEGLAPQEARKISSQCSAREEATWRRKKKEGQVGRDEGGQEQTELAISLRQRL